MKKLTIFLILVAVVLATMNHKPDYKPEMKQWAQAVIERGR